MTYGQHVCTMWSRSILQRVRRYNIYQRAEREYQEGLPNFLEPTVSNIERVDFGEKQQAHLSIDFILLKPTIRVSFSLIELIAIKSSSTGREDLVQLLMI